MGCNLSERLLQCSLPQEQEAETRKNKLMGESTNETAADIAALLRATGQYMDTPELPEGEVSEEEVASVEAVSKKLLDTAGGTSIEIVLSPAVKKVTI